MILKKQLAFLVFLANVQSVVAVEEVQRKLKLLRKYFPNRGFGASPQREFWAELFGAMAGARAQAP